MQGVRRMKARAGMAKLSNCDDWRTSVEAFEPRQAKGLLFSYTCIIVDRLMTITDLLRGWLFSPLTPTCVALKGCRNNVGIVLKARATLWQPVEGF